MTHPPRSRNLRDSAEWRVFVYLSQQLGIVADDNGDKGGPPGDGGSDGRRSRDVQKPAD